LANISTVAKFIPPSQLRCAILMFFGVLIAHMVQRWVAAMVAGGRAAGIETEKLLLGLAGSAPPSLATFDLLKRAVPRIELEMGKALWPPFRWLVRRQAAKIARGDLVVVARMQIHLMQLQSLMVLLQLLFALGSIGVVAISLRAP
jgi:hypothetical protein